MIEDFSEYEKLEKSGKSIEDACIHALKRDKDFAFLIRMLRSVHGLELAEARDIAGITRLNWRLTNKLR